MSSHKISYVVLYITDLISFADTGNEHPRTYAYLPIINAYLARHGFPLITVVRYVPKRFKHAPYSTLAGNCLSNSVLPSLAYGHKSCSSKWKAAPQEKYILKFWKPGKQAVREGIPIRRLIGYDAGNKDQKRGAVKERPEFIYGYPLRIWGFDRQDCKAIISQAGLPQPGISACFFCPSCKPDELRALAIDYPDLAARAIAIEDRAQPKLKKFAGLWRNGTKGTRNGRPKPGKWRVFLESCNLMPKLRPEHYQDSHVTNLPAPDHVEIFPYLHVNHYHAKPCNQ